MVNGSLSLSVNCAKSKKELPFPWIFVDSNSEPVRRANILALSSLLSNFNNPKISSDDEHALQARELLVLLVLGTSISFRQRPLH
jgi:hypothetical protein